MYLIRMNPFKWVIHFLSITLCLHLKKGKSFYNRLAPTVLKYNVYTLLHFLGGDDSDNEEEIDSNNDGGSMVSERADKDEEAFEGKHLANIQTLTCYQALDQVPEACYPTLKYTNLWVCSWGGTLIGTMRKAFQL